MRMTLSSGRKSVVGEPIFIIALFVANGPDSAVIRSFEWATTYVLPWLIFVVAVDYLYPESVIVCG